MNLSPSDILLIVTVLGPVVVSLAGALYKHLVDRLPSNQRQAVVDTVRIATHAVASDPSFGAEAETVAASILKELHLPASPTFIKSLVAIFKVDAAAMPAPAPTQEAPQSPDMPPVGFVPPAASVTGPSLGL